VIRPIRLLLQRVVRSIRDALSRKATVGKWGPQIFYHLMKAAFPLVGRKVNCLDSRKWFEVSLKEFPGMKESK
jgi:hypothetical protein